MRSIVALICLIAVATPLAAQSNAERIANDQYTRSHDYDLVHQAIVLSHFDWDSTSFDGQVTTTLVALKPAMDSIVLDAGSLLGIQSVTGANNATLRFKTHGDSLVVFPARPLAFRDTLTFRIVYHGKVQNGQGLTFIEPEGRPHRPQQIWSQGEDHNNHYWFPTYDFPNDKMSWDMTVTIPRKYTAVSNGTLVSDKKEANDTHTVHWRETKPSATYLVSLIVAPLVKIHDSWHGVPVDYYVYHSDSSRAWRLFHPTVDMIDTYAKLTGIPYPWAKYAQTTVADFFGGMENVSATTLVDWLPDDRAYQDRPWYQWILIPHELAHQWFGDDVTTENWANMWLNEGFAEFMPGQYWLKKLGAHAADDYYLDEYRQFLGVDQRRRMPLASLGSNNIYPKGALVLRMLKQYLGPQRFWASLHTYLTTHAFSNATSDDLRQAVLAATGQDLSWFWSEWVYGAGYPQFRINAKYDSTGHSLTLSVQQTQSDSAKPDSTGLVYTTPQVFHMPVTVRVGTANGDVTQSFQLNARAQALVVSNVMSAPSYVVFDDGNRILKTLTFDEPTAWLAAQLTHDPSLWNRQWVIDQLADRTKDSAAAVALERAATGADYFLTRAGAVEALGEFGGEALPALRQALQDTSAQVRQAAVGALAGVGGDAAIGLVRGALERDSSYAVHAAAINALTQLHAPGVDMVIRRGLRTPSYQDAVQNASLRAIAHLADTSLVDAVDSLVGTADAAPAVLAALATRGSAHALDLLGDHLDDSLAFVRRRAAFAFAQMPANIALPKLQALQGTLTHEDAKNMVSRVIAILRRRAASGGGGGGGS